jgi:hypothetical protein
MQHPATAWRFQCPECGFGDHEVGHLTEAEAIHCIVCLEEHGRVVRLEIWMETVQARLRDDLAA